MSDLTNPLKILQIFKSGLVGAYYRFSLLALLESGAEQISKFRIVTPSMPKHQQSNAFPIYALRQIVKAS